MAELFIINTPTERHRSTIPQRCMANQRTVLSKIKWTNKFRKTRGQRCFTKHKPHAGGLKDRKMPFSPWWPWPSTSKLVQARDQTCLPCEFGANPYSCSRYFIHKRRQKRNLPQFTACGNDNSNSKKRWAKFPWCHLKKTRWWNVHFPSLRRLNSTVDFDVHSQSNMTSRKCHYLKNP